VYSLKLNQTAFIILAGGKSSRFNNPQNSGKVKDKLLSKRGSITLLEHVITQLKSVKIPIFIITRDIERIKIYSDIVKNLKWNEEVFILRESLDNPIGPLGGITTAVQELKEIETKIFLPADLPYISSIFLEKFMIFIRESSAELIGLLHPNGQIEHLIFASKGKNIDSVIETLTQFEITRVSSIMRLTSNKQFAQLSKSKSKCVLTDLDHNNKDHPELSINCTSESFKPFELAKDDINPSNLYEKFLNTQDYSLLLKEANFYIDNGLNSLALHTLLNYVQFVDDENVKIQIEGILSRLNL
jgi:molybdopterin-guanine dinucleotide biosynthesis protein A